MSLDDWVKIATIIGGVATALTGAATVAVLWYTVRITRFSKQSDVLLQCTERFSRVWEMRANPQVVADPIVFYERFWSLQLDQFTHWKNGFIDAGVFDTWMKGRYREWQDNEPFGNMKYRDGYEKVIATWETPKFKSFMLELHNHGPEAAYKWWKANRD